MFTPPNTHTHTPHTHRAVLFGQWGFARRNHQNLTILLHGPPGTGKSVLAEAIGYEVGKPLKVVNCGELLSKWVGESSKNIDSIFAEGRQSDAILVFDEAEGLFGQRTEMRCGWCVWCGCVEWAVGHLV